MQVSLVDVGAAGQLPRAKYTNSFFTHVYTSAHLVYAISFYRHTSSLHLTSYMFSLLISSHSLVSSSTPLHPQSCIYKLYVYIFCFPRSRATRRLVWRTLCAHALGNKQLSLTCCWVTAAPQGKHVRSRAWRKKHVHSIPLRQLQTAPAKRKEKGISEGAHFSFVEFAKKVSQMVHVFNFPSRL